MQRCWLLTSMNLRKSYKCNSGALCSLVRRLPHVGSVSFTSCSSRYRNRWRRNLSSRPCSAQCAKAWQNFSTWRMRCLRRSRMTSAPKQAPSAKRWKMSMMTVMMVALAVLNLVAWSGNWWMNARSTVKKPPSDWEPSCKDNRNGYVFIGNRMHKTTRRKGGAFLSQFRLFGDEGNMTVHEQIQAKISTMETISLRRDQLAVPKLHASTAAAMSVIGSPSGPVCKVHIYTDGSFKELTVKPKLRQRGRLLSSWSF